MGKTVLVVLSGYGYRSELIDPLEALDDTGYDIGRKLLQVRERGLRRYGW